MSGEIMAKSDNDWEIESDARTLVDAEVIRKDPKRYKKAIVKIKEQNAAGEEALGCTYHK